MLLHRCKWQLEQNFRTICNHYVRYLKNNYGSNIFVVFDGYTGECTKSAERYRRSLKNASTDLIFEEYMPLKIRQEKFLANSKNKNRLIQMLRKHLADNNIFNCQAEGDADTLIVQTAINIESENVVVVAEDIDVLVLLTALTPTNREIYFLKPARGQTSKQVYSNKSLEKTLPISKEHVLFLHAFTGCDTTSAFYNKGKNNFAKLIEKRKDLQEAAEVFRNSSADIINIFQSGILCILALYGAPPTINNLNQFRYQSFIKATSKNSCVNLASLVPTHDAAMEHIKRVYLQVQLWLGQSISPKNWGWKIESELLQPITMTQPPAPENLLKMIFCSCKTGCGPACGCRKSGLHCSPACSQCKGNSCLNATPVISMNEIENEDNE